MNPVWLAVAGINLATFVAFGVDKRRAVRGGRRVPESTLLMLSFATGAAAGWLAMHCFRHKTRKGPFRAKMAAVTVVNAAWPLLWLTW